uniref:Transmembrane protein 61 n=1 Tax=Chelonoidis abingdonii TaxID=106734 RepID=A0A8C0IV38_CHEAB
IPSSNTCAPGCRMAASFRYGVTITGAILLVTGTLCFAWWSDGEVGPTSNNDAMAVPHGEAKVVPNSSSSNALLRSVSFFCCGIGGFLLLFGLLWSVKANALGMSQHYQYHFSRDLYYFTVEPLDKRICRLVGSCPSPPWDSCPIQPPTFLDRSLPCPLPPHPTPPLIPDGSPGLLPHPTTSFPCPLTAPCCPIQPPLLPDCPPGTFAPIQSSCSLPSDLPTLILPPPQLLSLYPTPFPAPLPEVGTGPDWTRTAWGRGPGWSCAAPGALLTPCPPAPAHLWEAGASFSALPGFPHEQLIRRKPGRRRRSRGSIQGRRQRQSEVSWGWGKGRELLELLLNLKALSEPVVPHETTSSKRPSKFNNQFP